VRLRLDLHGGGAMTHTPGPWKFYDAYGNKHILFARLGNDDVTILEAAEAGIDCVISSEDDARLIAAAPRMFDLLKRKQDPTCPCEFCTEARAIIAAAEGAP